MRSRLKKKFEGPSKKKVKKKHQKNPKPAQVNFTNPHSE